LAHPGALRYAGEVRSPKPALVALGVTIALTFAATHAGAELSPGDDSGPTSADEAPFAKGIGERSIGRPSVKLDRLEFAPSIAATGGLERHFRFALKQAARKADWGAGRRAKIEFRVTVEELTVTETGGVLNVRCTAFGRLPKGKSARSRIAFSGSASQRKKIVAHVLEIVARGVVTRLAALERERRIAAQRG